MKSYIISLFAALLILLTSSCTSTSKLYYMQGIESLPRDIVEQVENVQLRIQPDDQLLISINSRDPELIKPFNNYALIGTSVGATSQNYQAQSMTQAGITPFLVSQQGNIHFPMFGDIHVQGMTCSELSSKIETMLREGSYVNDASVKVKLVNFKVTVLGEVKTPGTQTISKERCTLLEALGGAGDLLPSGQRENILVMREADGHRTTYTVDLTQARAVYESPVYYLHQNDVIYVQPNDAIKVKGSSTSTYVGLYASIISVVTTVASLAVLIAK